MRGLLEKLLVHHKFRQMTVDAGGMTTKGTKNGILEEIKGIYEVELLTYLKLSDIKTGLINFNMSERKDGIKRYVL